MVVRGVNLYLLIPDMLWWLVSIDESGIYMSLNIIDRSMVFDLEVNNVPLWLDIGVLMLAVPQDQCCE